MSVTFTSSSYSVKGHSLLFLLKTDDVSQSVSISSRIFSKKSPKIDLYTAKSRKSSNRSSENQSVCPNALRVWAETLGTWSTLEYIILGEFDRLFSLPWVRWAPFVSKSCIFIILRIYAKWVKMTKIISKVEKYVSNHSETIKNGFYAQKQP